jgi:uncharacterized membrane protein
LNGEDNMDIRAIAVGGLLPALCLGMATVLMKLSFRHHISIPAYVTLVGATICIVGLLSAVFTQRWHITLQSGAAAIAMGCIWSCASIAMAIGLTRLDLPVAIIAPLSNSNAIVAVLLSALLFREWETLNVMKVLLGTALIVAGASLVSTSNAPQ